MRDYPRLPIEDFGRHLLTTGDLDPVYIALYNMTLDRDHLARWLIAYWCYYHCGAASWLSERGGAAFWAHMMLAARNEEPSPTGGRWPRGHERRHFRGAQATRAIAELQATYGARPEDMVRRILAAGSRFEDVANVASTHRGFGPWISFKIADMLDRCLPEARVDFTEAAIFMYKDPREAALRLWVERVAPPGVRSRPRNEPAAIHGVVRYLANEFQDAPAPPKEDRPVGLQEIETILCKWKSHCNGHYPLLNDTIEIHEGLADWPCETATAFHAAMPQLSSPTREAQDSHP